MTLNLPALRAEAASGRAGQVARSGLPGHEAARDDVKFRSEIRAKTVDRGGLEFFEVEGYASVADARYEMWDWFGPYTEVMDPGAFAKTLAAQPMVVYRFNHGGTPMATTQNGRLELSADTTGLHDRAWLNPKRPDVQELVHAIEDRDVTEQSFMFRITAGEWSPDYTEFRVTEVDLDRGDVGPVTYGANPATSVSTRSSEFLHQLSALPPMAARAALEVLSARSDLTEPPTSAPTGRGLSLLKAQLETL